MQLGLRSTWALGSAREEFPPTSHQLSTSPTCPHAHLPALIDLQYMHFCVSIPLLTALSLPLDDTDWAAQLGGWDAVDWGVLSVLGSARSTRHSLCGGAEYLPARGT